MKTRTKNLFKNGLVACAVGMTALLSAGSAGAQQYTGAGSTNQYGGSANQYRIEQMQAEADRQRRNTERLEEIRRNNQFRRWQEGNVEYSKQQWRYQAPPGYWPY